MICDDDPALVCTQNGCSDAAQSGPSQGVRSGNVGLMVGLIIAFVLLATLIALLISLLRKKKRDEHKKPDVSAISEDSVPELGSKEAKLRTLSQLAKSPSLAEES